MPILSPHQGYILLIWLIALDVNFDPLVKVVFGMFSTVNLSFKMVINFFKVCVNGENKYISSV